MRKLIFTAHNQGECHYTFIYTVYTPIRSLQMNTSDLVYAIACIYDSYCDDPHHIYQLCDMFSSRRSLRDCAKQVPVPFYYEIYQVLEEFDVEVNVLPRLVPAIKAVVRAEILQRYRSNTVHKPIKRALDAFDERLIASFRRNPDAFISPTLTNDISVPLRESENYYTNELAERYAGPLCCWYDMTTDSIRCNDPEHCPRVELIRTPTTPDRTPRERRTPPNAPRADRRRRPARYEESSSESSSSESSSESSSSSESDSSSDSYSESESDDCSSSETCNDEYPPLSRFYNRRRRCSGSCSSTSKRRRRY